MPTAESPKLFAERYLPVRRLGKGGMSESYSGELGRLDLLYLDID